MTIAILVNRERRALFRVKAIFGSVGVMSVVLRPVSYGIEKTMKGDLSRLLPSRMGGYDRNKMAIRQG